MYFKIITPTKKTNMITFFENLTVKLHIFHVLTYVSNFAPIECYVLFG